MGKKKTSIRDWMLLVFSLLVVLVILAFKTVNVLLGDLRAAFGPPPAAAALVVGLLTLAAAALGFGVQRRFYGDRAVGLGGYAALSLAALVGIAVVSGAAW